MRIRPWHFANTTVRSPFRLREGLIALANSPLGQKIKGKENESKFAWVLHNRGVVNINIPDRDVSDMGRKWRSAMNKMGFLYPQLPASSGISQEDLGEPFAITPNGQRLIDATSVSAMQECFLRSMAAIFIPSTLERGYPFSVFSPLRYTLKIMIALEHRTGDTRLNLIEMGLFVQFSSGDNSVEQIVDKIVSFRVNQNASEYKRKFDQEALKHAVDQYKYKSGSFRDYADLNFRYLKATGLVQSKGRGIAIVPEKRVFIEQLVAEIGVPDSDRSLLITLCEGATLPTDNRDAALIVLDDLLAQLNRRGVPYTIAGRPAQTPADIAVIRHEIEDTLAELNEEEYAGRQAEEWSEIIKYMDLLINPRRGQASDNADAIVIPQAEAPAYFEWVLWRAFLAIDSLVNKPYAARRFKIDQDFLPVGTAPGNGPDLIFEFEDFVVVVEVTLTESSRQEAVEGEPVRRHVAELVAQYEKPVYGMFLANRIDSNTAETFRLGVWYARDNRRMRLDIVPFTLAQFKIFFESMFTSRNVRVAAIRELLETCGTFRPNLHAPEWKAEIEQAVQEKAASLIAGQ